MSGIGKTGGLGVSVVFGGSEFPQEQEVKNNATQQ
jgi:hypothetical protein